MDRSKKRASARSKARADMIEDWYARYRDPLLRYWMAGMPPHKAEELVQEIFSRLLKVKDTDLIRSPRYYLFKIGRNVLAEWHKGTQRMPLIDGEPEMFVNETSTDSNPPEHQHQIEQLRRALAKLPPTRRSAIILHTRNGLTYDQVAEHLGISKRMVKRYMLESYVQLRQWLDGGTEGES